MHGTLKCLEAELSGSLTGLTVQQTGAMPRGGPERWTIQQIVEHLILTYQGTIRAFERRIAKGRPTRRSASIGQRIGQFYVVRLGRFPAGRMAPAETRPTGLKPPLTGEELIDWVQMELRRMDAVCAQAVKLFGNDPAISHPILGPMPVDSWRTFHLVHGEHHVRQILRLRNEIEG